MKHIEIVRNNHSSDIFIDGVKQQRVLKVECWFDNDDRCMKFRIETDMDNGHTYAQVFSDFTLTYRRANIDDRMREAWCAEERIAVPTLDDPNMTVEGSMNYVRMPFNAFDITAPSAVTESLIDQLKHRDAKGREKYGTSLDRKDLSLVDWLQHQTEELLDGAGYAQAAKREAERLMDIEEVARGLCNAWDKYVYYGTSENYRIVIDHKNKLRGMV